MAVLRRTRRGVALAAGLADIAGWWDLERVTAALTALADAAIDAALGFLLRQHQARGDLVLPHPDVPTRNCGIAVLGMGKLGARELNYSSDIDLIVIHDPEIVPYHGRKDIEHFCVRVVRDLVRLLEDRTRDGFVARVDLRLRPDPSAMPVAIPFGTAEVYYESLGQNWERAAMIKARACAGDTAIGNAFLKTLRPFVWRKHLDFWAIQDVHSIKRQIQAHRGGSTVTVAGHNIKTGRGGIREIEFYVQTQQLIWGGRDARLRTPRTEAALDGLAEAGHIDRADADALAEAYRYLRRIEHRLQMMEDQQTQTLPADPDALARFAGFAGYASADAFAADLLRRLHLVEDRYAALFEEEPPLSGPGNLVFTGGEPEPDTLDTLHRMGFADGQRVFHMVANWHRGRYRCTRSRHARELLTELIPSLLEALSATANPDAALTKFDEFLAGLPAGVQLFSMLYANPRLLEMLASIVGAAPALADHLSRRPGLLETVLSPDFFEPLPDRASLAASLDSALTDARDYQDVLDLTRRWAHDRTFQVGVHFLQGQADVDTVGRALSDVAEVALGTLWPHVEAEFAAKHGRMAGPGFAVVGLGKLGGREMTISSDLDLIFVAEADSRTAESDGLKPLDAGRYFTRLAKRLIDALSAPLAEGTLYEVDMRLRPQGQDGPLVTSVAAMAKYYGGAGTAGGAWTWEHMALTRARPVVGDPAFTDRIAAVVRDALTAPRDVDALLADVRDMRARIAKEHPPKHAWHIKYLHGGLIDLEFLAQTLQLQHAATHPDVCQTGTQDAFRALADAGLVDPGEADELIAATRLMRQVQGLLRLMAGDDVDEDQAPDGLKAQLAHACGARDFDDLRARVLETAARVRQIFDRHIGGVAERPNTDNPMEHAGP
jgi:glutamate-ammonia-ligase adenylyltransferase